jgi:hypothetical protein
MSPELELKLKEKYPKILKDLYGDPMKTCMAWGIETKDGWYDLLDNLLKNIQYYCNKPDRNVQLVASQIKSKFASLRFYFDLYPKDGLYDKDDEYTPSEHDYKVFYALINYAEDMSTVTCEICGNRGKTFHMGWHSTYCDQHATEIYGDKLIDLHKKLEEDNKSEN